MKIDVQQHAIALAEAAAGATAMLEGRKTTGFDGALLP